MQFTKNLGGGIKGVQPQLIGIMEGGNQRATDRSILRKVYNRNMIINNKTVSDSSDFIRYKKLGAKLRTYNDNSFGGTDLNLLFRTTYDATSKKKIRNLIENIMGTDTDINSDIGSSVSISGDGKTLAIGSPSYNTEGKTFIFRLNENNDWVKFDEINSSNSTIKKFGKSVSLSNDGNTLAIGSFDIKGFNYIYKLNNNNIWEEIEVIQTYAYVDSISLSGDGNTVAIGMASKPLNGQTMVFRFNGNKWKLLVNTFTTKDIGTLTGPSIGCYFGKSVSLSDDGNTLAVGAPIIDKTYIYTYSSIADSPKIVTITSSNISSNFGCSVSLSGDGNTLAVGALQDNYGKTRVFNLNNLVNEPNGIYIDSDNDLKTAYSVSLNGDGKILAVGAKVNNINKTQIFKLNGNNWESYEVINGKLDGDNAGHIVSLSNDGNTLAIGATNNNYGQTNIIQVN